MIDEFQEQKLTVIDSNQSRDNFSVALQIHHIVTKLLVYIPDADLSDLVCDIWIELTLQSNRITCNLEHYADLRNSNKSKKIFGCTFSETTKFENCANWSSMDKASLLIKTSKPIDKAFDIFVLARNVNAQIIRSGVSGVVFH